ncbi:DNA polymerase III subunit delta [Erysipelothrix sp. HDW6C]|uniref:DNA polymerase III subunit delta n=1 Tax=Erysipelothrix sp. HDW6C TaxID=2714930 RepID=UPI001409558B|nr:DNA polymerase III subunit delta [Erysipelothrix sp. HDW6C]QIK70449.1 DNA polymerase III subunit delta [Erysipelothrix sp. HDW6C]
MLDVIFGKNDYLIQQKIDKILKDQLQNYGEAEVLRFDMLDREFTMDAVFEAAFTVSLFGDKKRIILTIREKEAKKASEEQLLELMGASSFEISVVLVFDKKPLAKTKLKKQIDKTANVHTISELTENETVNYVNQEVKRRGLSMNERAVNLFASRVGIDLLRMQQEFDKLEVLGRAITEVDVELLVARSLDDNIFALSDALVKKKMNETFTVYHDLLALKMDPLALIGMVAASLRRTFQVSALVEAHYQANDIARKLDISEKQAHFLVRYQAGNATTILSLLNRLGQIDQDVKLGKIDRFVAFELFMIEVMR